jgi:hypothetical protein
MTTWYAVNNFGDTREGGLAGPTGLVIILLLAIGTILLIRNMNARLRRLPERFESDPRPAAGGTTSDRAGRDADGVVKADSTANDVTTED